MSSGQPVWCNKCHIRIAPYDLRTVYRGRDYHRHCFLRMIQQDSKPGRVQSDVKVRPEKRK